MKKILTFIFILAVNYSYSQLLSGDLVEDNRKLLTKTDFRMEGSKQGEVVYDLAVDAYGNVTSSTLVSNMTTVASTPTRMEVRNYVNEFKFEPGTLYPKFHHVKVKITVVTKKK
jgi:hypothetical protein